MLYNATTLASGDELAMNYSRPTSENAVMAKFAACTMDELQAL